METTVKKRKSQRFVARVTEAAIRQSDPIQLDADQSRRFVEALLAPPRPPTPALKRAMARYRRDVTSIV